MQTGNEHARLARYLFAGAFRGVLSTHSLEHAGYPFGSMVPYMLDLRGSPLLLLSHLSQHTRNIDADPHCGLTIAESGSGDVQQLSRLSTIGKVLRIDAVADAERYFNYFPQTRVYHEELGFRFYRFEPKRFHWNGGFATARWFDPGRITHNNPFSLGVEQQIIGHMNTDHADALQFLLRAFPKENRDAAAVMVGIDDEGMDLRIHDRLLRIAFPRKVTTAEEARAVLVEMAEQRN